MGYDRAAQRRPVNLNLNSDLVERCRAGVDNLSAYVETLLASDLERREREAAAMREANQKAARAFADHMQRHGTLADALDEDSEE